MPSSRFSKEDSTFGVCLPFSHFFFFFSFASGVIALVKAQQLTPTRQGKPIGKTRRLWAGLETILKGYVGRSEIDTSVGLLCCRLVELVGEAALQICAMLRCKKVIPFIFI